MAVMRVCSAGVPLGTAGVFQRMERNGLGPELEESPTVTSANVCSCAFSLFVEYSAKRGSSLLLSLFHKIPWYMTLTLH